MVVLSRLSAGLSVIGVEGSARLAKLAPYVQIIDPATRYANNAEWRADWPRLFPLLHRVLPSLRIVRHRTHTGVDFSEARSFPAVSLMLCQNSGDNGDPWPRLRQTDLMQPSTPEDPRRPMGVCVKVSGDA